MTTFEVNGQEVDVIWEPIPGTSQELAVDSRCDHTLYHGARGPGKTVTQLMYFRKWVGVGYGAFWRGVIFDREFKNFTDIVTQAKRFFGSFDDGARFHSSAAEYKWVWPTGEELLFRHAKKIKDYDNFHGHEYPYIGWNELTKYPTSDLYDKMQSTNRSSFDPVKDTPKKFGSKDEYDTPDGKPLPPIPLKVFSTTNSDGPGHNWVKRQFITASPMGTVVKIEVEIFNPKTKQEEVITLTQIAIFGSYRENIYLDPKYVAMLNQIKDPILKEAWLKGSWDVNAGGAFDDLWSTDVHIIPRFKIPMNWRVDRSFDWGSSHPFCVVWWAEANGEEIILPNGDKLFFPRGTLIAIADWYGTKHIGTNKGLKMSAPDVAVGIVEREKKLKENNWIQTKPRAGPADNQIDNVTQQDEETIKKKMEDKGVKWTKSDKSSGSRTNGFELFRDMLQASIRKEGAGIYFMVNCEGCIQTLPSLPRDDDKLDDVDTDAEDHPWDTVRYRVLKGTNRLATKIPVSWPS